MIDIHWETITSQMRQVLSGFARTEPGSNFYLAGGTALALQLGHRISEDLDYFSATEDILTIRGQLETALTVFDPVLLSKSWGNLLYLTNGVRVGFFSYGYPMVSDFIATEGIRLAGIADIGLMKLDAIMGRASRKDFIDLYMICQQIPLRQLLALASQKYPNVRDFTAQVIPYLANFASAEKEAHIPMIKQVDWEIVKETFRQQAISIGRSWIE